MKATKNWNEIMDSAKMHWNGKSKKLIVVLIAAIVLLAVIVAAVPRATVIDLNEYVTIEYSGYDGRGFASVSVDYAALQADYGAKIKYVDDDDNSALIAQNRMFYASPFSAFRSTCISGRLANRMNLSNGDKITFLWECDDSLALELFGVKLKYENIEFTVSGLK